MLKAEKLANGFLRFEEIHREVGIMGISATSPGYTEAMQKWLQELGFIWKKHEMLRCDFRFDCTHKFEGLFGDDWQGSAQQLRQQRVAQGGEGAGLVEVGGDLGVLRRDLGGEGGHEFLWRQRDADGAEVLFADFGEGGAGGAAFDLGHALLAPVQHEVV